MEPSDQREQMKSNSDLMTRRLKNRERQRRYRARKRLEADMKKGSTLTNASPLQVEMQGSGVVGNHVSTVHCKRNWKKDARSAHAAMSRVSTSTNECLGEAEAKPLVQSEIPSVNFIVQNGSERSVTPGRRHWKAEARNKKS
ncbi:uncharacterized protein LOC127813266 [Diospyros lotus]|uniref:uncharacterized protein LOC127813266 n=1 Tax=Diospyros lotus TaxID=55363 RepID=UPI00225433D5|nr:uncharacterized protein LOC127813266 [Diospyros lotus]XP_052210116.1 uncharacterized protein LOC127813266 [Diospyros lotus]